MLITRFARWKDEFESEEGAGRKGRRVRVERRVWWLRIVNSFDAYAMLRYDVEKRVSDYRWIYNPWISREEKKKRKKINVQTFMIALCSRIKRAFRSVSRIESGKNLKSFPCDNFFERKGKKREEKGTRRRIDRRDARYFSSLGGKEIYI